MTEYTEQAHRYHINVLYMIPSALHQLTYNKKLRPQDFATVIGVYSGGAHLPPTLAEVFKKAIKAGPDFACSDGAHSIFTYFY